MLCVVLQAHERARAKKRTVKVVCRVSCIASACKKKSTVEVVCHVLRAREQVRAKKKVL